MGLSLQEWESFTKTVAHLEGNICAPLGFRASGVAANIRGKNQHRKDMALIYCEKPAVAAAVFTQNIVKAAPIIISQEVFAKGIVQAIIINSRCANACTGPQGLEDAKEMCSKTAEALNISPRLVACASTGVIGEVLPMAKITAGISTAVQALRENGGNDCAEAILTTDTHSKEIAISYQLEGSLITIGGIAKGAGMVHPNLATILGFITTDAEISSDALHYALQEAASKTFNMISIDGDCSTNDMLTIMASGMARNPKIELDTPASSQFLCALEVVLKYLAKEIVRDGEGVQKIFEVQVIGARSNEEARLASKAVCRSLLVKTAIFGSDPNWGRIVCALGYSGAKFDPDNIDLHIGPIQFVSKGLPIPFDEDSAVEVLKQNEILISVNLNSGQGQSVSWGCDLSYEYVRINGAYRT